MYGGSGYIECVSVSVREIGAVPSVSIDSLDLPVSLSVKPVNEDLVISCSIVCTSSNNPFIRFKESLLSWYGRDNNEGVIKYNTLTASGKWTLEEVEIEELL